MKKLTFITITLLSFFVSLGQTENEKPSNKIIEEGVKLYDEDKYEEALKKFQTISRNDSNYSYCLYEMALTHSAIKNYDKTIELSYLGLKHKTEFDNQFYQLIASSYDEKGDLQKAVSIYDQAIKTFPLDYKLQFEKGVTLIKAKKYKEAESCFMKSVQLNPFHASSHLYLGHVYRLNGYIVPAIYAYMAFLIAEPASKRSLGILVTIEDISMGENLPNPDSITNLDINKEAYNEAELILQSGVARDKKYKLKTKVDFAATRQMQSLFEKVEYNRSNNDFWMQYYVPFFNDLFKNNYFETFTYNILQSIENNEKLNKTIKSATADIEKFSTWVSGDFNKKRDAYFLSLSKSPDIRYIFYPTGMPKASGVYNERKKIFDGDFEYYYPGGYISGKGRLDEEGKKQGTWEYYYTSNRPKSVQNFKDDLNDGEYFTYFENGKLKEKGTISMGKTEGNVISYYPTGCKNFEGKFKADIKEGKALSYHNNGLLKEEAEYKGGGLDGINKTYYYTGELKDDLTNKNDHINGKYFKYHKNSKVAIEGQFISGLKEGEWIWFYENGKVERTVSYKADKENGKYFSYFEDGIKETEADYVNGKLSGKYFDYDEDGIVSYEANYSNDKLVSYKFMNKKGKIIAQATDIKNEQQMKIYYPEGQLKSEGKITNKTTIGLWKYYDIYGNLTNEENFDNKGELNGIYRSYFKNGQLEKDCIYKDGNLNGYYKAYFINGKLSEEGRYEKGIEQGNWKTYYINGALKREMYYLDGDLRGYDVSYSPDNKKEFEDFFEDGYYNATTSFDTTGKIIDSVEFNCGEGKLVLNYQNNKSRLEVEIKNGKYDGMLKKYFPNGKPKSDCSYYLGVINGLRRDYSYNGNILYEGYYKNGELDSISKNYDEDGKLSYVSNYKNGNLEGEATWYYPNGQKEVTTSNKQDKRNGYYSYYAPDGTLILRFKYEYGKLRAYAYLDRAGKMIDDIPYAIDTKVIKTYYPNGNVSAEINYEKAAKHGKAIYYYSSGKVMEEIDYFFGYKNGKNNNYYENGNLKSETTYFFDEKQGLEKKYTSMGKLLCETNYDIDMINGPRKTYDSKTGKLIKTINYVYNDPYE